MKNVKLSTAVLMSVCAASVTAAVSLNIYDKTQGINSSEIYSVLSETNNYVKQHFYKDVDNDAVLNGVISGYMSGLSDNYARYQSPVEYKSTVQSDGGHFIGIGVTVTQQSDGYIIVTEVSEESPASEAGILPDDIIIAIDGSDVAEVGYNEAISIIKSGENDTEVNLTIKRDAQTMDIPVKRVEMDIITSFGQMLDNNTGYIRIKQFNHTTPDQMKSAFDTLVNDGAERFIFDLRDNPGGIVTSVEKCLDPFLPEGDIAVANYNNGKTEVICRSDENEMDIPIVILINGNSASGAELFAAAMRDFGKAELVGIKSFGKGIMQTTHSLSNGGAIVFTVATYQTTKSDCYHEIGIYPDYEVEMADGDDTSAINPEVDAQLKKAVEVVMNIKK
ncbi:MAG: S41 family peptidase [Oscillospiraceae bacterium]